MCELIHFYGSVNSGSHLFLCKKIYSEAQLPVHWVHVWVTNNFFEMGDQRRNCNLDAAQRKMEKSLKQCKCVVSRRNRVSTCRWPWIMTCHINSSHHRPHTDLWAAMKLQRPVSQELFSSVAERSNILNNTKIIFPYTLQINSWVLQGSCMLTHGLHVWCLISQTCQN